MYNSYAEIRIFMQVIVVCSLAKNNKSMKECTFFLFVLHCP